MASSDISLVINVPRAGGGEANAIVRGVSPLGAKLRPQVRLTKGRWFTPGKREVIVSERLAGRLATFSLLSETQRAAFISDARVRVVPEGERIVSKGDEATCAYFILDGEAAGKSSANWTMTSASSSVA